VFSNSVLAVAGVGAVALAVAAIIILWSSKGEGIGGVAGAVVAAMALLLGLGVVAATAFGIASHSSSYFSMFDGLAQSFGQFVSRVVQIFTP